MSNKRIQKKRLKKRWERDRSKLIAAFLVAAYPGMSRGWYLEEAKPLFELDRGQLLNLIWRENLRRSPFMRMVPRKTWTGDVVNWRPITNMEVK